MFFSVTQVPDWKHCYKSTYQNVISGPFPVQSGGSRLRKIVLFQAGNDGPDQNRIGPKPIGPKPIGSKPFGWRKQNLKISYQFGSVGPRIWQFVDPWSQVSIWIFVTKGTKMYAAVKLLLRPCSKKINKMNSKIPVFGTRDHFNFKSSWSVHKIFQQ